MGPTALYDSNVSKGVRIYLPVQTIMSREMKKLNYFSFYLLSKIMLLIEEKFNTKFYKIWQENIIHCFL